MALAAAGLGVTLVPRLGQEAGRTARGDRPPARRPAPARHVFAATCAGAERRPAVAAVLDALSSGSGSEHLVALLRHVRGDKTL